VSARRGFTLVELLIVIAIIGILMALLFPAITGAFGSAAELKCQNNMGQLVKVVLTYCEQNNGTFPLYATQYVIGSASNWLYVTESANKPDFVKGVLVRQKFLARGDVFYCPLDQETGLVRSKSGAVMITQGTEKTAPTSYAINASITYDDYNWPNVDNLTKVRARKFNEFDPNDFLFIEPSADAKWDVAHAKPDSASWPLTDRHRGGGYVACFGGSVQWMQHDDPYKNEGDFKAEIDKVQGADWYRKDLPNETTRWNPG
jgi:prepilin-type N-terminal cleavage/methylation domain-containing protein